MSKDLTLLVTLTSPSGIFIDFLPNILKLLFKDLFVVDISKSL